MEDCIRKTAVETLDVITAGEATPHPAEVLDVEAIGRLVDEMKFYYDLILVDTAPLLPVSDPMLLALKMDGTVLVVKAEATQHEVVSRVVDIIDTSRDKALNLLTVDLEEWFVVDILSDRFTFDDWDNLPSTIIPNNRRLLDLFRRYDVTATWFVLCWAAQKYPQLIREIFDRGHEIACHSYRHLRVDRMNPDSFRKDTEMAVEAIAKAIGLRPVGYRAPSWSINATIPWAFETLAELDFEYVSSIFPVKYDLYGVPGGPRQLYKMYLDNGRSLYEIPASTYRLFGRNIQIAGGGFLSHAPYWYSN